MREPGAGRYRDANKPGRCKEGVVYKIKKAQAALQSDCASGVWKTLQEG